MTLTESMRGRGVTTGRDLARTHRPASTGGATVLASATIAGAASLVALVLVRLLVSWPAELWVVGLASVVVGLVAGIAAGWRRRDGHDDDLAPLCGLAVAVIAVVTIFLVIVVGLGRVPEDDDRQIIVLSMISAACGAMVFGPIRRTVARRVKTAIQRDRPDPAYVLELFGTQIRRDLPLDEILLQVAETLRRTMQIDTAEIWTFAEGFLERRVSVPDQGRARLRVDPASSTTAVKAGVVGPTWLRVWLPDLLDGRSANLRVATLSFSGEFLGLVIAERADSDLTAAEESILDELGRQVGLALHNTQLDHALHETLDALRTQATDLVASRRRLVTASDEERRRIERDLHDGAQQHLVALSVGLKLAADVVSEDPVAGAALLSELRGAVQDTIDEVRALAHGIYPPLLRDSGLGSALRAAAARNPLDTSVDDGGLGRYPADIESAVYFCCLEALQNASKHAEGASVEISIGEREGGLFFDVVDDGPGFDRQRVAMSAGFTNMSDRVGAVGGRVDWITKPDEGVRVSGVIPLPA